LGIDDFNQTFFDKIDDIENQISTSIDFKKIISGLNIVPVIKKNYIDMENKNLIENKIYKVRNNKIALLENDGKFILYKIDKINTKLPDLKNDTFRKQIKTLLYEKKKYDFNKKIFEEINNKKFTQNSFNELGKYSIENIKLDSIRDNKKFELNSIKILYSLPVNSFTLVAGIKKNIYVAKILKYEEKKNSPSSEEFDKFTFELNAKNKNNILKSYDYFLNSKYKVTINENTLDRVKNYFK